MPEQELRRDLLLFSLSKWPDIETAMKMAARMEQFILQGNVDDHLADLNGIAQGAGGGERLCEQTQPATDGGVRRADAGEPSGHCASSGMAGGQKRRWSTEDDENLRRHWHSDRPLEEIAEEMGRTVPGLYCRARALGFSRRSGQTQPSESTPSDSPAPRRRDPAAAVTPESFTRQQRGRSDRRGQPKNGTDRSFGSSRYDSPMAYGASDQQAEISIDRIIHFLRSRDYSVTRVEDGRYRLDGRRVLSANELREKANQVRQTLGQPPFAGQQIESVG